MMFSTLNLIDPLTLARSTRAMLQSAVPKASPDNTAIMAGVQLALADLDAADPLVVQREIDVHALRGQDSPIVKITTRHYGSHIDAIYLGDMTEANQVVFDVVDDTHAQIHETIDADTLHALIRLPRQAEPLPLSDLPAGAEAFTPARCILNGSSGDPYRLLNTDGVTVVEGDRMLVCLSVASATNGIYSLTGGTVVRASDAAIASAFTVGKMIRVTEGVLYGDTVWEIIAPAPVSIGASPIYIKQSRFVSTIDASQANAIIIPRAAAYVALAVCSMLDKTTAAQVTTWATALLARQIPILRDATSHRLITATRYAQD